MLLEQVEDVAARAVAGTVAGGGAGGGFDDFGNEVRHGHFDVKLYQIGQRVEADIEKRIVQTHHAYHQNIHGHGYRNTKQIKPIQPHILGQSIGNQARTDQVDEVGVQPHVDDGEYDLLGAVPVVVYRDVALGALQTRGDPYTGDADVDGDADGEDGPLETTDEASVGYEKGDSSDDDLEDAVDLDDPEEDCSC